MGLAFLPKEEIEATFRIISNALSMRVRNRLMPFLNYFQSFWLDIIKPVGFNIFGLEMRTNNCIESFHSRLQHNIETHPQAWDFYCKYKNFLYLNVYVHTYTYKKISFFLVLTKKE